MQEQFALFLRWHYGCWRLCIEAIGEKRNWDVVGININTKNVHCAEIKTDIKDLKAGLLHGQFEITEDIGTFNYVIVPDINFAREIQLLIPSNFGILYRKQSRYYGCKTHSCCPSYCKNPKTNLFKFFRPAKEMFSGTNKHDLVYKWLSSISQTLTTRSIIQVENKLLGKRQVKNLYKQSIKKTIYYRRRKYGRH